MFTGRSFWGFALVAGASLFSACAFGASGEITGFGGGASFPGGGGSHAVAGGSAAYLIGGGLRVFGEFSYVPMGSTSFSANSGGVAVQGQVSEKLLNYGGGIDYSFGKSERIVPYMLVAVGAGHLTASGTGTGTVGNTTASASAAVAMNGVNFGAGGGVRFYAGKHWGFKPEFRYQRFVSSGGGQNEVYITGGVFYQFGK
jgi:hypothetical protein